MSEWNLRNLLPQAAGPILADLNASGSSLKLGIAKLERNLKSWKGHGQFSLWQSSILVNPGQSIHLVEEAALHLGWSQVVVISNHILQAAPSQCGQGRHCGFHLDESETGWNGTSGEGENLTLYQVAPR